MESVSLNARMIDAAKRAIVTLFRAQNSTRQDLVRKLQGICEKCDDAYSSLLQRLVPVKASQRDPIAFASELRALAGDSQARALFKPEQLCSDIDGLLADLANNLATLKYSVNYSSINGLRQIFQAMGNYDGAMHQQYDSFMLELDSLASQLESTSGPERDELARYAASEIDALEQELRSSIASMRGAKASAIAAM
jgi:hypothetical protein